MAPGVVDRPLWQFLHRVALPRHGGREGAASEVIDGLAICLHSAVSSFADRRAAVRSEVVGRLRGALEIAQPARVVNISSIGALIETSMSAAIGSNRPLQLTIEGQSVRVETCVRSLSQISGEPQALYAIGVEFVSPSESLTAVVGSLIAETQSD